MGGAPAGPVASPDHAPSRGIKGIQVSSGACREGPASVGIPQLQGTTWQRATAEVKSKKRFQIIQLLSLLLLVTSVR